MTSPRSIRPEAPSSQGDDTEERGSRVMRFGAAVTAVILASVVATMPAAVRIGPEVASSCGAGSVWLSLLAIAFLPVGLATVVLRHALAALRLFDARGLGAAASTVFVWAAGTLGALAALGAVLRATTHHHGLAGVTFAVTGLGVAVLALLFARRVVQWARGMPDVFRWPIVAVGALAIGATLSFFAQTLARSGPAANLSVDLAAFVFASVFGASAFPYRSRPVPLFAFAGPPLAVVVVVAGLGALRGAPALRIAIEERAPLVGAALELTGGPARPR